MSRTRRCWAACRLSARREGGSMPPLRCNYIRRGRPLVHGGCRGKRSWRRRPSPAMPVYRTCPRAAVLRWARVSGPCSCAASCVSLGDVEAEPERAPPLTVRRYDTVQDGAATRLAAPAGGARRALQPGALVRSLYLRAGFATAAGDRGVCLPSSCASPPTASWIIFWPANNYDDRSS